jgi:lincosamide nucleotidyltransferase A/C/D/E
MRRFLMRRPHLRRAAHWALRVVDDLPSWAQAPFDPIRKQLLRDSGPAQLLTVVDALEAAGVPYWVAGGWGVDVLLGRQTRMHRDLDIVVDRFDTNEPRARRALETIGYRHIKFDRGGIWMPLRSTLDDESGHKVELMGIDWSRLTGAWGTPARSEGGASEPASLAAEVFAEGTVDGRRLPCLSAQAQLLFHTGFQLEPAGRHNVEQLGVDFTTARSDFTFDDGPDGLQSP